MLEFSPNLCRAGAAFFAAVLLVSPLIAGDIIPTWKFGGWDRVHPRTPLQEMANTVDKLEKEIDTYGSVVVKQPDVWGEARWTKHRADYEKILFAELGNFKFTINAKVKEADTAFLLNAASLGASMNSGVKAPTPDVTQIFTSSFPQPSFVGLPSVTALNQQGTAVADGVAIEPTEFLDQLSRYVQHLNQLRRINEGDDTADAAGYALNLIRIPVSVLPGRKTRTGYGAEVTMTLTPELSEDLLPTTFKDLVLNDLVDQLGLPLVKLVDRQAFPSEVSAELQSALETEKELFRNVLIPLQEKEPNLSKAAIAIKELKGTENIKEGWAPDTRQQVYAVRTQFWCVMFAILGVKTEDDVIKKWEPAPNKDVHPRNQNLYQLQRAVAPNLTDFSEFKNELTQEKAAEKMLQLNSELQKTTTAIDYSLKKLTDLLNTTIQNVDTALKSAAQPTPGIGAPRDRQSRYPVAPTEIACVFGDELQYVAKDLDAVREASGVKRVHLPDAHGFLTEELDAAYTFLTALRDQGSYDAWTCLCPRISRAIKMLQYNENCAVGSDALESLRKEFQGCNGWQACEAACHSEKKCRGLTIRTLAWAILVESALLNDHLLQDMQRIQTAKGCPILPGYLTAFYGPDPDPAARGAFNAYVRCRWPIHVFAIDPENQEQNVSDSFARRREMQLALALAFTGGKLNANQFSRFARRLDFELDTISLNRTVVGFSHGDDTFGWRVYPRVQVPPVDGNFKVMAQLVAGGPNRDADLRRRQLEPGARECLAVVIMPSFVPYLRLDVRTNWFQLTKPDKKEFTTEDSVRLGQMVTYLKQCKAQVTTEEPMGRPGDLRRLLQSTEQLEKRLPLQDTLVQIPYENSRGGFQLFSEGTRNLGPELIGFYGEPGINAKGLTTLFVVGRHFNVNGTQVTCGGQDCTFTLLSRDVMKVVIPKDTMPLSIDEFELGKKVQSNVVDMRVATPYGVSGHLFIPVIAGPAASASPGFDQTEVDGFLVPASSGNNLPSLQLVQTVKWKGLKKDTPYDITININAVMGDGTDVALTTLDAGKATADFKVPRFTPSVDDMPLSTDMFFNKLVGDSIQILSCRRVIALKVSGKRVESNNPKNDTPVGPLLIKLCPSAVCLGAASGVDRPCLAPEPRPSSPLLFEAPAPIPAPTPAAPAPALNGPVPSSKLFERLFNGDEEKTINPASHEVLGNSVLKGSILSDESRPPKPRRLNIGAALKSAAKGSLRPAP